MTAPVPPAYVGLGANLGDAAATLRAALAELAALGPLRVSQFYRSAPLQAAGPDFVNAVAEVHTPLEPQALLGRLQAIEHRFGRERPYPHAPRTLDLDLLLQGDRRLNLPSLTLPHPRLHQRAFVLVPLLALAPDLEAPGLGPLAAWLPGVADQAIEPLAGDTRSPAYNHDVTGR